MESHKLALKFFVENPSALTAEELVPVFHSWIQRQAMPGHLLIDVADYKHVPDGPGTVLVAHEANIAMDRGEGRLGLLYVRKQAIPGAVTFAERLRAVFGAALASCAKLEEEPSLAGRLHFRTDEVSFRIHDRLHAPHTPETFAAVKPDLEALVSDLWIGSSLTLEPHGSPRALFDVRIKSKLSPPVASLLAGLGIERGA
jgi:hypothetical protein